jgi:3-keto-disaccharide hydrolase
LINKGEKSVDYRNWPENDGTPHPNANEKVKPHNNFVRRFMWPIIAIVSILLVLFLAYSNISMRLDHSTAIAPIPTHRSSQQTPASAIATTALPATPTPDTPTPALTSTVSVQAGLPCKVNLSTWADGSSDWKILNGILLNDGSNTSWNDQGPTIVAPCQPGNTTNYAVEAQIQVTSSTNNPCFGITLRGTPSSNGWQGYEAGVGDCSYNGLNVAYISGPGYSSDQQGKNATFDPTTTKHTYRIEARNNTITFFIDGNQLLTMTDNRYLTGAEVGLWSQNTQLQVFSLQVTAL